MKTWIFFVSLFIGLSWQLMSCVAADAPGPSPLRQSLKPCSEDVENQATLAAANGLCGTYEVWENRETKAGRKIALDIAVIPAIASKPKGDPIFMLSGGPGQAATEMDWLNLLPWVKKQHVERDVVLVDQRGTGTSNPLDCFPDGGVTLARVFAPMSEEVLASAHDEAKKCVDGYDADVHQYTTDIAMDDLNEVREALGYEKINLYGISYGTRAAHVYLRRHGDTVRSCVLESVAPMEMKIIYEAASDGERALKLLFADCAKVPACQKAFGNLDEKVRTLLGRLEAAPAKVSLPHPTTGVMTEVTIGPESIRMILFSSLYDTHRSALIPLAIEQATNGNFTVFASMFDVVADAADDVSKGLQAAVLCNEDLANMDSESPDAGVAPGIFSKKEFLSDFTNSCDLFSGAKVSSIFFAPVTSDVPTLVLSGNLDPVTPPRWGEIASKNLAHSRHIVVPGTGHLVSTHPCVSHMVHRFLDDGTTAKMETACLGDISRTPIFVTPTGYTTDGKNEAQK